MIMIETENLGHRFSDGSWGLKEINLTINQGDLVVIAGPNGSGKTTLLKNLNGLLRATEGAVRLMGEPVTKNPKKLRLKVGMVFQDADSQIVGETVFDDAAFGPENMRLDHDEVNDRVRAALATTGLEDLALQRPHLLSGGEKRRLCIAGVLAMDPEVILFDEPFSNLDHPGTLGILQEILKLKNAGRTMVIATHDVEKILAYAHRLVIMDQGRVVKEGKPADLLKCLERFGVREPCASRLGMELVPWLN